MIRTSSNSKKTRLNPVSKRKRPIYRDYFKIRKAFLEDHPTCMVCNKHMAIHIHHKLGRQGSRLTDTKYFLAICSPCHFRVENNRAWAMKEGFSMDRLAHD